VAASERGARSDFAELFSARPAFSAFGAFSALAGFSAFSAFGLRARGAAAVRRGFLVSPAALADELSSDLGGRAM
jgi:hypothetical protein